MIGPMRRTKTCCAVSVFRGMLLVPLVFATSLATLPGCANDQGGGVGPIKDVVKYYVVEFATAAGKWVDSKASTLSDALLGAWRKAFPEVDNHVEVDQQNRCAGRFRGTYRYKIVKVMQDNRTVEIELTLNDPVMQRDTETSPWELAPSNYEGVLAGPGN